MTVNAIRPLATGLVAAAVTVGAIAMVAVGGQTRHLTAEFERSTSLYSGAKVKVLGVDVGEVESLTAHGKTVRAEISYDSGVALPPNVHALIVPPSVVGDRFVQLAPAYVFGPKLRDQAHLGLNRTGVPIELDDAYRGLDRLAVGLGPNGANADGALSDLVSSAADAMRGNGEQLRDTIEQLSAAVGTLDESGQDATRTVTNLSQLTTTFAGKDDTVRALVTVLVKVARQLSDQRKDTATAVADLRSALKSVATFTEKHRDQLHTTIGSVADVSETLRRRSRELERLTDLSPVGFGALLNTYMPTNWDMAHPESSVLDGRTGSLAIRIDLLENLDVALGYTLSGACEKLPADQRAQLAALCDGLQRTGGDLGKLLAQATNRQATTADAGGSP